MRRIKCHPHPTRPDRVVVCLGAYTASLTEEELCGLCREACAERDRRLCPPPEEG